MCNYVLLHSSDVVPQPATDLFTLVFACMDWPGQSDVFSADAEIVHWTAQVINAEETLGLIY